MTVKLWDVETKKAMVTWSLSSSPSVGHQQLGNTWVGEEIVSLSHSGYLNTFDPRTSGKPSRIIYGHQKAITAIAREPSGSFFSGSYDGRINCFSADGQCAPVQGAGHSNQIMTIAAGGGKIYSTGMDDCLREIDGPKVAFSNVFASTSGLPRSLSVDSSGICFVATVSDLQIFKAGQQAFTLPVNFSPTSVAVTAKGDLVASGSEDSIVRLFKTNGTKLDPSTTLEANRSTISALAFSPDGSLLAVGDSSGKIIVYDTASAEIKTSKWVFHTGRITSIAWSPNGQFAASTSLDTNIFVWSVAKPSSKISIKGAHPGGSNALTWVDDNTIATAGTDATIRHFKLTHS